MFTQDGSPALFGVPCGAHYPSAIKNGLLVRLKDMPPEVLARTEIFVNTSRMKKEIQEAFEDGSTRFLPKLRLLSQIGMDHDFMDLPVPISGLRRRLELAQLVSYFLKQEPQFATSSSVFDLSDSLALLFAEMKDEGVSPDDIQNLKVPDASGHWQKSLQFLSILFGLFADEESIELSSEDRLRLVTERLEATWATSPPDHPILVVGSTGSRGMTARFMSFVAKLPMGAVILPGVDFDMPSEVWAQIHSEDRRAVEHPQERMARMAHRLGMTPDRIQRWDMDTLENQSRNRLVSLALRPAPITDQWMKEGPAFEDVESATDHLTLIEAPDMRIESNAIALVLRRAVHDGKTAALITPDRDLARRVTALLGRWNITPDDSAGIPLNQTPPGRLLRHVVGLIGRVLSSEDLLVLLKHPLCARGSEENTGPDARGFHLLWTRELEVHLRRKSLAFPGREELLNWAISSGADKDDKEARLTWAGWVADQSESFHEAADGPLSRHLDRLLKLSSRLVRGPKSEDDSELWAQHAGREARRVVENLYREADHAGVVSTLEFGDLFRAILSRETVRDPSPKHPQVMIWGTLEARALGSDLVILGSLNETVWPQSVGQDPWFSRDMRRQAGLLSPEQSIGLSAHDFQQAIGAPEVIITRAKRDAEAETVASCWLIRLTNLLAGMSDEGRQALGEMRARGSEWIALAEQLDRPEVILPAAKRPSPRPPVAARPRQLSVTRVETLIRDPYDIYASRILRLNKLDPLSREPDVRERGTALHAIMEAYLSQIGEESHEEALSRFLTVAEDVLEREVSWPSARRVWLGRIRRIADALVTRERERLAKGTPVGIEAKGAMHLPEIDFSLTCKADRIDRKKDDTFVIYDYKTGDPPTEKQTKIFNIQLHLEAAMMEDGKFENVPMGRVSEVAYLGLKDGLPETVLPLEPAEIAKVKEKLVQLITSYEDPELGYSARRMMKTVRYETDFEHLSRYGEWSDADTPVPEDLE
ncbi:double-strand break repair protein AddB [uncultured Celeribacter sp.]|uniref:double-strand break repair protein AddB n=1 Tax=uncultured Celeribacter sp. TaxID=1303376 RepID=UPI002AA8AC9A|nr:double-strand break repair protein AddB [uncultured Celeribacter sp.]